MIIILDDERAEKLLRAFHQLERIGNQMSDLSVALAALQTSMDALGVKIVAIPGNVNAAIAAALAAGADPATLTAIANLKAAADADAAAIDADFAPAPLPPGVTTGTTTAKPGLKV